MLEYVRRDGSTDDRTKNGSGFRRNTTDRGLVLIALAEALGHLSTPCDVTVFLEPEYLVETFPTPWKQGWVDEWEKNGWKTSKGQEVKCADLWKNALPVLRRNFAVYKKTRGINPYKSWICSEINRASRGKINDCSISENSKPA